jgi:carbon-monoxide dehydrogenase iron sulfur subunit
MGCHTCELACAGSHSLAGEAVLAAMNGERPGYRIHVETYRALPVPVSCQHCEEAACVAACPTGAVHRNSSGKPVLVDETICIGCSMCVQACPFGMMAMTPGGKVAIKCDLCVRRLAKGLLPACVSSCPTHALLFEQEEQYTRDRRREAASRMVAALEADRPAT